MSEISGRISKIWNKGPSQHPPSPSAFPDDLNSLYQRHQPPENGSHSTSCGGRLQGKKLWFVLLRFEQSWACPFSVKYVVFITNFEDIASDFLPLSFT